VVGEHHGRALADFLTRRRVVVVHSCLPAWLWLCADAYSHSRVRAATLWLASLALALWLTFP